LRSAGQPDSEIAGAFRQHVSKAWRAVPQNRPATAAAGNDAVSRRNRQLTLQGERSQQIRPSKVQSSRSLHRSQ